MNVKKKPDVLGTPVETLQGLYEGKNYSALLVGNGQSRHGFDLHKLSESYDLVFGCNIIYFDIYPHFIFTLNIHILREMLEKKIWEKSRMVYMSHGSNQLLNIPHDPKKIFYLKPEGYIGKWTNSGHLMAVVMLMLGVTKIHIIGVDMDSTNMFLHQHQQYQHACYTDERLTMFNKLIHDNPEVEWKQINNKCLDCPSQVLREDVGRRRLGERNGAGDVADNM